MVAGEPQPTVAGSSLNGSSPNGCGDGSGRPPLAPGRPSPGLARLSSKLSTAGTAQALGGASPHGQPADRGAASGFRGGLPPGGLLAFGVASSSSFPAASGGGFVGGVAGQPDAAAEADAASLGGAQPLLVITSSLDMPSDVQRRAFMRGDDGGGNGGGSRNGRRTAAVGNGACTAVQPPFGRAASGGSGGRGGGSDSFASVWGDMWPAYSGGSGISGGDSGIGGMTGDGGSLLKSSGTDPSPAGRRIGAERSPSTRCFCWYLGISTSFNDSTCIEFLRHCLGEAGFKHLMQHSNALAPTRGPELPVWHMQHVPTLLHTHAFRSSASDVQVQVGSLPLDCRWRRLQPREAATTPPAAAGQQPAGNEAADEASVSASLSTWLPAQHGGSGSGGRGYAGNGNGGGGGPNSARDPTHQVGSYGQAGSLPWSTSPIMNGGGGSASESSTSGSWRRSEVTRLQSPETHSEHIDSPVATVAG